MEEICPKCFQSFGVEVVKTRHHILPRRFFRDTDIIKLCRKCHDELERRIPEKKKLPEDVYYLIVNNFIGRHVVERTV